MSHDRVRARGVNGRTKGRGEFRGCSWMVIAVPLCNNAAETVCVDHVIFERAFSRAAWQCTGFMVDAARVSETRKRSGEG